MAAVPTDMLESWMAIIKYISDGRRAPQVQVAVSRNGGHTWQQRPLGAGQTFAIPPDCTNLLVDNVPYDPKINYVVRHGRMSPS